jgi:hypothetical protein
LCALGHWNDGDGGGAPKREASWLTASLLLSFQHLETTLPVPLAEGEPANLLSFQLQGDDPGLPVVPGHPREHDRQA